MMMAAPARIVVGEVDRRIDDDDESSSGKHHGRRRASSDGNHANDDHHGEDVSVTLVIDPMCALDLVRHIIAATSHVEPENLRQGRIENLQWGKLAEATGLLSEWPITVVEGTLAETRLTFGEDFACWIFQCESSTEVGGAADIFIDVALGPEGVELVQQIRSSYRVRRPFRSPWPQASIQSCPPATPRRQVADHGTALPATGSPNRPASPAASATSRLAAVVHARMGPRCHQTPA